MAALVHGFFFDIPVPHTWPHADEAIPHCSLQSRLKHQLDHLGPSFHNKTIDITCSAFFKPLFLEEWCGPFMLIQGPSRTKLPHMSQWHGEASKQVSLLPATLPNLSLMCVWKSGRDALNTEVAIWRLIRLSNLRFWNRIKIVTGLGVWQDFNHWQIIEQLLNKVLGIPVEITRDITFTLHKSQCHFRGNVAHRGVPGKRKATLGVKLILEMLVGEFRKSSLPFDGNLTGKNLFLAVVAPSCRHKVHPKANTDLVNRQDGKIDNIVWFWFTFTRVILRNGVGATGNLIKVIVLHIWKTFQQITQAHGWDGTDTWGETAWIVPQLDQRLSRIGVEDASHDPKQDCGRCGHRPRIASHRMRKQAGSQPGMKRCKLSNLAASKWEDPHLQPTTMIIMIDKW